MMNLSGFCLWYGVALGATAVITYTDVKAYWIPDAPVLALAVINILALCFGWAVLVADVNLGTAKDAKTRMMETQISISNMEKPFRIVMIKKLLSRSNNGRGHIE